MIQYFIDWKKCIPDFHEPDIYAVDFEGLYAQGLRILLLDIDNTLVTYEEDLPGEKTRALLHRLQTIGFTIVLISNNNRFRIEPFARSVGLPAVFRAKKPLRSGFKRSLNKLERPWEKEEVLVLGDQVMTDVYGAKRFGISVLLVQPLRRETERWYTGFNRLIEHKMLQRIKKKAPERFAALGLERRVKR